MINKQKLHTKEHMSEDDSRLFIKTVQTRTTFKVLKGKKTLILLFCPVKYVKMSVK